MHDGRLSADGARPVDFVVARMQILHDEEEETLVVFVELKQLQQDIKVGVAQSAHAFANLRNLRVIHDVGVIPLVVFIHNDGAVYPHGKLIEEVFLLGFHLLVFVRRNDVLGLVFAKG